MPGFFAHLRVAPTAVPETLPGAPVEPSEVLVWHGALSVIADPGMASPGRCSSLLHVASIAGCSLCGTSIGRDGRWMVQFWRCTLC